ncbi:haloacid dehalogenase-like hydrolase (HAD) superfamily protein [Artemisia annua]|uniref:Haloacid dehalogenase-like hydrolase (HAD) superfamily protein n=1 Tax=Artemisia annua TaxID=35608 RepID=A0A2U1M7I1_ARTAN|nr:haloacid dehalogenase-like hydrolase (HAD) superfamily protein [Artemisia annua]
MVSPGQSNRSLQPAEEELLPMMTKVYEILLEKIKGIRDANVENNKLCLSQIEPNECVFKDYPKLRLTQGLKVLDIRPTIKWDKGKAIEFPLKSLGYANSKDVFPIYIGDNPTDEDAFKLPRYCESEDKDLVFWCLKYLRKVSCLFFTRTFQGKITSLTMIL